MDITAELEQYVYEMTTPVFAENLDQILKELSESYKLALLSNSGLRDRDRASETMATIDGLR